MGHVSSCKNDPFLTCSFSPSYESGFAREDKIWKPKVSLGLDFDRSVIHGLHSFFFCSASMQVTALYFLPRPSGQVSQRVHSSKLPAFRDVGRCTKPYAL